MKKELKPQVFDVNNYLKRSVDSTKKLEKTIESQTIERNSSHRKYKTADGDKYVTCVSKPSSARVRAKQETHESKKIFMRVSSSESRFRKNLEDQIRQSKEYFKNEEDTKSIHLLERLDQQKQNMYLEVKEKQKHSAQKIGTKSQKSKYSNEDMEIEEMKLKSIQITTTKNGRIFKKEENHHVKEFSELKQISINELVFEVGFKQKILQNGFDNQSLITCFWKTENKFVSLIPFQKNQHQVTVFQEYIMRVHGSTHLKNNYIVTDEFKNCSLKSLLEEFAPFDETLSRKYLKQIAKGLQSLHFNKISHSRLNLNSIFYTIEAYEGEILISAIKSAGKSLNSHQKSRGIHFFSPELLLSVINNKSMKNDIWALGCIAILMLTNESLNKSKFHPYNSNWGQLSSASSDEKTNLENISQRYPHYFEDENQKVKILQETYKIESNGEAVELSDEAIDFIGQCLQVVDQKRPSIHKLLDHAFFKGA